MSEEQEGLSRPQNETRVALELFSFAVQRHVLGVGVLFDNYRNFVVFYQPEAEVSEVSLQLIANGPPHCTGGARLPKE